MDLPSWFVCVIGIGTVFAGLIFLILICRLVSFFAADRPKSQPVSATPAFDREPAAVIENRGEVVAAVSAAIAEDLGEEISHIRILSIKKI